MIARARESLARLEQDELSADGRPRLTVSHDGPDETPGQLGLFAGSGPTVAEQAALDALRGVDPDSTTPMAALQLLAELRARLAGEEGT